MLSLPSFDNQRLIFHAARQTLRKAEMARLAVHEWLNYHDFELEEWKTKTASELGISISELERKLLAAAQRQAIMRKRDEDPNPIETCNLDDDSCTQSPSVNEQIQT
ncbi:hypothetical protein [aff. Roholtiella sp. LEGE 12411]|uniref:hypothetical protein n=1 Tax=aff. Roholtiella sp. LEGE 12411 TaxID=1828822 RepID=UPI001FC7C37B|nr:hypothetical protein [aff. Roholtiella sp. LEGE 12411]